MISIIVPVYNAKNTICRCVNSIIAQTYTDWELILIDDGSSDNCGEICDSYAAKYQKIHVIHQKNQGVSAARNIGINVAIGEWITFVDSDDYLADSFLSNFVYDQNIDLQAMGMTNVYNDEKTEVLMPQKTMIKSTVEALSVYLDIKFFMSPWAKLFKTGLLRSNKIEFPTDICYTEDEIFVKKYLCFTKQIRMIAVPDYYYTHFNENSLTSREYSSEELEKCLNTDAIESEKLESILHVLPKEYQEFHIRRKAYLLYRLIFTILAEKKSFFVKQEKIALLVYKYRLLLQYKGDLPKSYLIVRYCLNYMPLTIAVFILNALLR